MYKWPCNWIGIKNQNGNRKINFKLPKMGTDALYFVQRSFFLNLSPPNPVWYWTKIFEKIHKYQMYIHSVRKHDMLDWNRDDTMLIESERKLNQLNANFPNIFIWKFHRILFENSFNSSQVYFTYIKIIDCYTGLQISINIVNRFFPTDTFICASNILQ